MKTIYKTIAAVVLVCIPLRLSKAAGAPHLIPIAKGWARNSINTVVFRRNSIVTHDDSQYVSFYDDQQCVVLAKRKLGTQDWEIKRTPYQGNTRDAHNSISIMVDGAGYLHMSWDHHADPLRYCRAKTPGSLELTEEIAMTGNNERKVTYPEFYRLPNGNLLFLYRDGSSGNGNLLMNHYDVRKQAWSQRQAPLIDGEGKQNAYWQMCTDDKGTVHLSWVWRAHGGIESNHDIAYAKSDDEGVTWQQSTGLRQPLPITAANAEYAHRVPTHHELINTTSMCADSEGNPYIATYWRPDGTQIPQYHLIYHDDHGWYTSQITQRVTPFSLSGTGTKAILISRPQIVADNRKSHHRAYMVFRDVERGSVVSIATCSDLRVNPWRFEDLTDFSVGMWEPSYDTELWKQSKELHIFVQQVEQRDGDKHHDSPPQTISILEWNAN